MFNSFYPRKDDAYILCVLLDSKDIWWVNLRSRKVFPVVFDEFSLLIVFFVESYVYIGMNDLAEQGVYVWDDGSPVTHSRFSPGEPNNVKQNRILLWKADGGLADTYCDTWESFFICETNYNRLFVRPK